MRFSPDGRTLFAVVDDFSGRMSVQRFDARSGLALGEPQYITRNAKNVTLMLTRDGRRVVTSFEGGSTVIRDARTLRPLRRLPLGAERAALSSDGRTLLVGRRDGSVRFLDLVTGARSHCVGTSRRCRHGRGLQRRRAHRGRPPARTPG